MTARCGSNDPAHRAKTCKPCERLYKARYRAGEPRYIYRARVNPATCILCGLAAGNSMDVPVYRYPLKRQYRKVTAWIGTVGLCDPCIAENAELRPAFRRAA